VSGIPRVVAVVVTRDRRELLGQSLSAVAGQTRAPDRIVVVDNASSDGTGEMLADRFPDVRVVALAENSGATGGFHAGIEAGLAAGADWLWLLDDDCFPRPTALEQLLGALERVQGETPALLGSRVEWRDGEPHPMNMPTVARRDPARLAAAAGAGLLPLRATTWVSLLLSRQAVERDGMPVRHFFYQADDIEYTARILRRASGYFVPESVVEHRTPSKQTWTSDERRFYYHARNTVLMLRGSAWAPREKPALAWSLVASSIEYLTLNRCSGKSASTLVRGLLSGLRSPTA
jgi:GT2 family glycosyltransferase